MILRLHEFYFFWSDRFLIEIANLQFLGSNYPQSPHSGRVIVCPIQEDQLPVIPSLKQFQLWISVYVYMFYTFRMRDTQVCMWVSRVCHVSVYRRKTRARYAYQLTANIYQNSLANTITWIIKNHFLNLWSIIIIVYESLWDDWSYRFTIS